MRFGIFGGAARGTTDDSYAYDQFIDMCVEAEELGFYGVALVEHHFTGLGQASAPLHLLSHLAAKTRTLRLGTAVTVLAWRNPVLLAEEAATIDLLSGGRLDLGVGKGYRLNEFRGMGVPLDEATERFEEAVQVLQLALENRERWNFEGKYWKFTDVRAEPEPVQRPPRLWLGASSPASITRAAERGFNLLLDQAGSFDLTAQRVQNYRNALIDSGQTWDPRRVAVTRSLFITKEKDEAWERSLLARRAQREKVRKLAFAPDDPRLARPEELPTGNLLYSDHRGATEEATIMGTPDECIAKLMRLEESGVEQVLFAPGGGIEALRLFHKEVMPAFTPAPDLTPAPEATAGAGR
jgi:alkanesulfonate monooxygenase SsuD/methylene tetrahydromethanopterin reductase-like flavin-dependent oxidoreductase (luciferase family)